MQRKRVPIIRRRYTKSSRGKSTLRTGRNSKKVRVTRLNNISYRIRNNTPTLYAIMIIKLLKTVTVVSVLNYLSPTYVL